MIDIKTELVVLVDEHDHQIGVMGKDTVHSQNTPLHRGFSLFLFNSKKQLLLTQRAMSKKTFPGIWTNTVCGHPAPNEIAEQAAIRRLKQEVGITVFSVKLVAPYRYTFTDQNGIQENEVCPIFTARSDAYPAPNPVEVMGWRWMLWSAFLNEIASSPQKYSPWCVEEAGLVQKFLNRRA